MCVCVCVCVCVLQLVGGPFDERETLLIREPTVLLLFLELQPYLSDEIQVREMWVRVTLCELVGVCECVCQEIDDNCSRRSVCVCVCVCVCVLCVFTAFLIDTFVV